MFGIHCHASANQSQRIQQTRGGGGGGAPNFVSPQMLEWSLVSDGGLFSICAPNILEYCWLDCCVHVHATSVVCTPFHHDVSQLTFLILLQYYFLISVISCLSNMDIQNNLDFLGKSKICFGLSMISKIIWISKVNPKYVLDFPSKSKLFLISMDNPKQYPKYCGFSMENHNISTIASIPSSFSCSMR